MDAITVLLLELCIKEKKWVGRYTNSFKLQRVPIEEFSQTFDYGLKEITKLDDFNQLGDSENSYFDHSSNRSSNSMN